ncbi:MAG: hypothetical protein ACYC1D_17395, partial [Acidimicrobiales bacterium]
GRPYQAGDRVLALRRGSVPAGALGTVSAIDPKAAALAVDFGDGPVWLERGAPRRLSHGYATTPAYLGRLAGNPPLVVLGDPAALDLHRCRLSEAAVVARVRPERERRSGELPPLVQAAASLGVAASGRPDPDLVARSLGELGAERDELGRRILAGLAPHAPQSAHTAADSYRDDLARWEALGASMETRADLLGRAWEAAPPPVAVERLGPVPHDPAGRDRWRQAVRVLAADSERAPGRTVEDLRSHLALERLGFGVERGLGHGLGL